MPNMLQHGATWLGKQLQAHAGRVVTLEQGGTTIEDLNASVVSHEHEVFDQEGFLVKVLSFDWTIVAEDLDGLELRVGAVITETIGAVTSKYEAMPLGRDKPCVERKDSSGILLTLHTKQVQ